MSTYLTLAQYRMDHGDHMDGGWHWGVMALMLLVLVAVIALAVWFVRSSRTPPAGGSGDPTPRAILDRRLAQGEITPDEHRERAAILGGG